MHGKTQSRLEAKQKYYQETQNLLNIVYSHLIDTEEKLKGMTNLREEEQARYQKEEKLYNTTKAQLEQTKQARDYKKAKFLDKEKLYTSTKIQLDQMTKAKDTESAKLA